MTDFDFLRWRLAELLPEMRDADSSQYHKVGCENDCVLPDTIQARFGNCKSHGYIPLPISGDGTRSWMASLLLALAPKGWGMDSATQLSDAWAVALWGKEYEMVINAYGDNPDHALAAAAVAALEARG